VLYEELNSKSIGRLERMNAESARRIATSPGDRTNFAGQEKTASERQNLDLFHHWHCRWPTRNRGQVPALRRNQPPPCFVRLSCSLFTVISVLQRGTTLVVVSLLCAAGNNSARSS